MTTSIPLGTCRNSPFRHGPLCSLRVQILYLGRYRIRDLKVSPTCPHNAIDPRVSYTVWVTLGKSAAKLGFFGTHPSLPGLTICGSQHNGTRTACEARFMRKEAQDIDSYHPTIISQFLALQLSSCPLAYSQKSDNNPITLRTINTRIR